MKEIKVVNKDLLHTAKKISAKSTTDTKLEGIANREF